jgi:uncharacterized membrane protein
MSDEHPSDNQPNTAAQILLASVPDGRRNTQISYFCILIAIVAISVVLIILCVPVVAALAGTPLIAHDACTYCKKSFEHNNVTYTLQHSDESSEFGLICKYRNDRGETKQHRDYFKLSCIIGLSISLSIGLPLLITLILISLYMLVSCISILLLQHVGNVMYNIEDKPDLSQDIRKNACCLGFRWPYVLYKYFTTMPKNSPPPSRYV